MTRPETNETTTENIAQTMRDTMEKLGKCERLDRDADESAGIFTTAHIAAVPESRVIHDLTAKERDAAEYLKPARRRGTARMADLDSLIGWANRFKGETSALFALPDMLAPSLTCVADYHDGKPIDPLTPTGDPSARHCAHRAVYTFPMSDEWRAWSAISGKPMDKDEMGEFIEAQALDVMDPTPAMIDGTISDENTDWENRLIKTAQKLEGRFAQLTKLLEMSRRFQVYETSDLTIAKNRDTGEGEIQFLNEHKNAEGAPLKVPNLITIAIPVFEGGAAYRLSVRFRYRKAGSGVAFFMTLYNPERAFKAALDEALATAIEATDLPLFKGSPES